MNAGTAGLLAGALLLAQGQLTGATAAMREAADTPALVAAAAAASAGDEIVLTGTDYHLTGGNAVRCDNPGAAGQPIVVRAASPLSARITSDAVVAFAVTGPYWTFKDLLVVGTCARDADCEHAFHVVGAATGFQLLNSRIIDFNAHLKVNADTERRMPDGGLVAFNTFTASHPRRAPDRPVTFVNIDNAANWTVRANLITNFEKAGGDGTSFGAFVKGGARAPVFESNLVICAPAGAASGTRVGLSFGGGGMSPALCPPHWDARIPCDPETTDGVMERNIVARCSDVGIYLNRASRTRLASNTLYDTQGIEFRFPSSTGQAIGNLLSSTIRRRDGGDFIASGNLTRARDSAFAARYMDPARGDFRPRPSASDAAADPPPRPGAP